MTTTMVPTDETRLAEIRVGFVSEYVRYIIAGHITEHQVALLLAAAHMTTDVDETTELLAEAAGATELRDLLLAEPETVLDLFDDIPPVSRAQLGRIADDEALKYDMAREWAVRQIAGVK